MLLNFKKKHVALFSLFILTLLNTTNAKDRPNIVLINIDDMGWSDVSYNGAEFYETPNIDKLAKQGMTFTQAYAAAANCAPSRACLVTGQWTPRHGVYTVKSSARGKSKHRKLIPTTNVDTIPDNSITLAHELKKVGYTTATIGKWHLSSNPAKQGFDTNIAGSLYGHPNSYFSPYKNKELADGPVGENLTDRLTNEAINFIEDNKDKTFFLYLPYYAVHTPLQGKEELIAKYKKKAQIKGKSNAKYAAMVETMDSNVGKLLQTISKLKLDDNTVIIFTSDNGGFEKVTDQSPLRAGKGAYYEGGIREPFIIKWTGHVEATSCHTPITHLDIYPTLLQLAGIKSPIKKEVDGNSLLPIINNKGKFPSDRALYWHFPIYLQSFKGDVSDYPDPLFRTRPGSAIRKGDWKLIEYFEDGRHELYNLATDMGEKSEVSAQFPDKAEELKNLLKSWRKKTNAPVPNTLNPDYNPQ